MAKVKMLVSISGTINGADYPAVGETADLPDVVADHLVDGGLAERVSPAPKRAAAKPETATAPEPKKRTGLTKKNTGLA